MADWVHCNTCFKQPFEVKAQFQLTNCGHIYCEICLKQCPGYCQKCKQKSSFILLTNKMKPEVESFFNSTKDTMKHLLQVMEFQDGHRQSLLQHKRRSTGQSPASGDDYSKLVAELGDKQLELQRSKEENTRLKTMIMSLQHPDGNPRGRTSTPYQNTSSQLMNQSPLRKTPSTGVQSNMNQRLTPGGRLHNSMAGHTPGQNPGYTAGHRPGQASGHTPRQVATHMPGYASRQAPTLASGQTPGNNSSHTPGNNSNHTPGHPSNHTPGHPSNHTPGQASNHTPGHTPQYSQKERVAANRVSVRTPPVGGRICTPPCKVYRPSGPGYPSSQGGQPRSQPRPRSIQGSQSSPAQMRSRSSTPNQQLSRPYTPNRSPAHPSSQRPSSADSNRTPYTTRAEYPSSPMSVNSTLDPAQRQIRLSYQPRTALLPKTSNV